MRIASSPAYSSLSWLQVSIGLLVSAALAVAPFLSFATGYHNNQRILLALCLCAVVPIMLVRLMRRDHFVHIDRKTLVCVAAFFGLGLLSSITAHSPRHAMHEWSTFFLLLTSAWLIASEITASPTLGRLIPKAAGLSCALYVFKVALIYLTIIAVGMQPLPDDFIFGFDNYRFFNHVQTVSLPLLVLLVLEAKAGGEHRSAIFWFCVATIWWTLIFLSGGRGTFFGLVMGLATTCVITRRRAADWLRMNVAVCLAGLGVYLLFFLLVPVLSGMQPFGHAHTVISRTIASPISGRSVLWPFAVELAREHPILGVGPMHFAHFARVLADGAHPHNWLLQIGAEWGLPALVCLLVAIWRANVGLTRASVISGTHDRRANAPALAWMTTAFAVLLDSLVSGLIVMPVSQLWLALFAGCAWSWATSMRQAEKPRPMKPLSNLLRAIVILLTLFALFHFVLGLMPELLQLPWFENHALDSGLYPGGILRPRVWNAGYF